MRQFYILFILLFTAPFIGLSQTLTTISEDNASNYGGTWNNGDNNGTGFQPWVLTDNPNGGFAGRYVGSTAIGDPAFGLFSGNNAAAESLAQRGFSQSMQPGDIFSVVIGHTSTINGELGLVLLDGSTVVLTLKYVQFAASWVLNDGGSDFAIAQGFSANTSLTFTFTYEGNNQYSYSFGSASGSNFTFNGTVTNIDGVRFFDINQGPGENFGINNLSIQRPTFTTIANGSFNDGATWENGDIPDGQGRVIINHDVTVAEDQNLVATDLELGGSGSLTMNSVSNNYSSLIVDNVSGSGTVSYNRFVNSSANGNDLISSPLPGEDWADFLLSGTNEVDLLDDGGVPTKTYAFAPFDKSASDYVNFDENTTASLGLGTGYRVATDAGTTLRFTGTPLNGTQSVNIVDTGSSFADWNLIGNPYPSYVSMLDFLNHEVDTGVRNIDLLESASGIYGYDGDASDGWTVITLANAGAQLFAPGQGFFVAADGSGTLIADYDLEFTNAMRSTGSSDDFILGRNSSSNLTFSKINISTATSSYNTEVYFDANATLGLDPGYDAAIFGGSAPAFSIYSHLVQDNTGIPIALQAVGLTDVTNVTIPLGVNSNAGEELTFDMSFFSLPANVEVYLDDNVESTSTLLNSSDYVITPSSNLNGTGRFFLRFVDNSLSTPENSLESLSIYTDQGSRSIHVAGQILDNTIANVYDIQGRLILSKALDSDLRSQSIDAQSLGTGIYVVELSNGNQKKVEKIILK
ncbi:T9SS type A sorting domain-containing protein [Winogradskyella tangerina]|uniref:T9SS type A sorting domain-containing protein n=1 Tax=Winogradskyella tangerina TaxID=2023240 RepID=UPI000DBEA156|nr:T9SS type A sorting domain-containing protein [Winogradskyella tangerina]